jgi:hypothetical protein
MYESAWMIRFRPELDREGVVDEYVVRWDAFPDGDFWLPSGPSSGESAEGSRL